MHVTLPPLGQYSPEAHFSPFVFVLDGMIKVNRHHIRQARDRARAGLGAPAPPLAASGVRRGVGDELADLYQCLQGAGNSESLTIWRCAELREAGEQADPVLRRDGNRIFCYVRRGNGAIEDVSRNLTGAASTGRVYDGNQIQTSLSVTLPPLGPFSPESHFAPLVFMLEGMIDVNRHHIGLAQRRADAGLGDPIPPLFATGVRYKEDAPGREDWGDIYYCLGSGWADCDRLAIWRCAERRELAVRLTDPSLWTDPVIKWQHLTREQALSAGYPSAMIPPDGLWMVHCLARFADGTIEDTSKLLGMGAGYNGRV